MCGPSGPSLTSSPAFRDRMMLSNVKFASFTAESGGGTHWIRLYVEPGTLRGGPYPETTRVCARQRSALHITRRCTESKVCAAAHTFDWNFNPKTFDRVQMEELATGDFIRRRTNLVMVGWSGIGKSHIIQALGQKACVHGYRVLYRTSDQLLSDLTASLADKTLPARLRRYANPDLLIIDEFGFDRIERAECPQAAHLLYKSIASRNQKRSTALVTNVDFDKWAEYLSDGPLAMAFLDRLVEGAIILKVKGKSYRA